MTAFFSQVYAQIAREYGWFHEHFNGRVDLFMEKASQKDDKSKIISVNNVPIDFDRLIDYKGTHLIRDPRDLLVSGYRYHLWCEEPWVRVPMDKGLIKVLQIDDLNIKILKNESYQSLLGRVDKEIGLWLEYNWRQPHFKQMESWNYSNPNILELKYEELFNNEVAVFERIFKFIGFQPEQIKNSIKYVEQYSFAKLKKEGGTGKNKHARYGKSEQWKEELPSSLVHIFKSNQSTLLEKLEYQW